MIILKYFELSILLFSCICSATEISNPDQNVSKKCFFERLGKDNLAEVGEYLKVPEKDLFCLNKNIQKKFNEIPLFYFMTKRFGIPGHIASQLTLEDFKEIVRVQTYSTSHLNFDAMMALINRETASPYLRLVLAKYLLPKSKIYIENPRGIVDNNFNFISYPLRIVLSGFCEFIKLIEFYQNAKLRTEELIKNIIQSDQAKAFAETMRKESELLNIVKNYSNHLNNEDFIIFASFIIMYDLADIIDLSNVEMFKRLHYDIIRKCIMITNLDSDKQRIYDYLTNYIDSCGLNSRSIEEKLLVDVAFGPNIENLNQSLIETYTLDETTNQLMLICSVIGGKSIVFDYLMSKMRNEQIIDLSLLLHKYHHFTVLLVASKMSLASQPRELKSRFASFLLISSTFCKLYDYNAIETLALSTHSLDLKASPEAIDYGFPEKFTMIVDDNDLLNFFKCTLANIRVRDEEKFIKFYEKFYEFIVSQTRRNKYVPKSFEISVDALKSLKSSNIKKILESDKNYRLILELNPEKSFKILDEEDVDGFGNIVSLFKPTEWLKLADNMTQLAKLEKLMNCSVGDLIYNNGLMLFKLNSENYFKIRKGIQYWLNSPQKSDILSACSVDENFEELILEDFPKEYEKLIFIDEKLRGLSELASDEEFMQFEESLGTSLLQFILENALSILKNEASYSRYRNLFSYWIRGPQKLEVLKKLSNDMIIKLYEDFDNDKDLMEIYNEAMQSSSKASPQLEYVD